MSHQPLTAPEDSVNPLPAKTSDHLPIWRAVVLFALLYLLTLTLFYQGYRYSTDLLMDTHRKLAAAHARAIGHDFAQTFEDQRRIIRTVLQDHEADLKRLVDDPDDVETESRLRTLLKRMFPTLFAFSIVNPKNGEFLLVGDALDGHIEQICYTDTLEFIKHPDRNIIRVHPNPNKHHYDLYIPVQVDGANYLLFTSFSLKRLQETLNRFSTPGHALLVVLHMPQKGDLIEFTAQLTRDQLQQQGDPVFIRHEMAQKRLLSETTIPDTRWQVLELATPALLQEIHTQAAHPYLLAGTAFSLIYWVLAGLVLRHLSREHDLVTQLEQASAKLQHLSLHDPLTGLCNRRCLDEALHRFWALAQRENRPLSVMMLDIDHFKEVNDTHGHQTGDSVLAELATLLRRHVQRKSDLIARYGGEEIAILLPDTPLEDALALAEKLRRAVETHRFSALDEPVTV